VDEGKRWLKAEDAATYVGVRVDQMRRLVRSGRLVITGFKEASRLA
jgi:hypothetical protein